MDRHPYRSRMHILGIWASVTVPMAGRFPGDAYIQPRLDSSRHI